MVADSDEGAPAERVGSISSYKRRLGFNCSLRKNLQRAKVLTASVFEDETGAEILALRSWRKKS
jgi:hypothetical protein